ncbi:MAG: NAD(P)-dependent oxidoreductase [Planctomycetota bacterium]
MSKPTLLLAEAIEPRPRAWAGERATLLDGPTDDHLAGCEGMVVRSYTPVTPELLDKAPKLKVVGRAGVGLDTIDVAECRRRGVEVVYTPDANTKAVAEFVAGLAVKLVRPWHANALDFTDAGFKRLRKSAGEHVSDLLIGVLGMGRVGRAVSGVFERGFGARVMYHDLLDVSAEVTTAGLAAESVSFDELVRQCDLLTLHVDGRPDNAGLLDASVLHHGKFRFVINTSRGLVVEPLDLLRAVDDGKIEGVAIDVYNPEPPLADSPYRTLMGRHADRVLLTPHMASRTTVAVEAMSWVVRDVVAVMNGQRPKFPAP